MRKSTKAIFFAATHRSGSTVLMECIRQLDILGRPVECFYPQYIAEILRAQGSQPSAKISEWLPFILRDGSSPNGIFSAKVFSDNFIWLSEQFSGKPWPECKTSIPELMQRYFPDAMFISIRRRDKFKQGLSIIKAMQTGVWHSDQHGKVKARKPYYQHSLIHWSIYSILREERYWDEFFDLLGIQPKTYYYEDIVRDIPSTIQDILQDLGLEHPVESPPKPTLNKLSNKETDQWLERFQIEWYDTRHAPQKLLSTEISPVFEINLLKPEEDFLPKSPIELSFEITSQLQEKVHFIGDLQSRGSIEINARTLDAETGEELELKRLPKPYKLTPGETQTLFFHYVPPAKGGSYQLELNVIQRGREDLPIIGDSSFQFEISTNIDQEIQRIFGPYDFTPDNWYYSAWFGYFYANNFPWILSLSHGWLRIDEEGKPQTHKDGGTIEFADHKLIKWTTSEKTYPLIHVVEKGLNLRYLRTEGEMRCFAQEDKTEVYIPLSKDEA